MLLKSPYYNFLFDGETLAVMSRVFAREAAQKVAQDGARWVVGSVDSASPDVAALLGTIPHEAIRAAQAGLLADMDRIANVLYSRAA